MIEMPKKRSNNKDSPVKSLRQRAEELLKTSQTEIAGMPPEDIQSLVHELQVHQIELEIQNEELRKAQIELAESRDRYSDLYEYAPVGYLTLDASGRILQANLGAARLLDVNRSELVGARLPDFVDRQGQDQWHFHRQAVFAQAARQTCELPLRTAQDQSLWVRLESEAVAAEEGGGKKCRTVLMDVSERKQAEQGLLELQRELEQRVAERTALLKMLRDVAAMANKATNVEEAIRFCLEQVCAYNGWNFGHAWLPANDDPDELISGYAWYNDPPERFERLRKKIEKTRIRRGEGLVGQVLASGKPEVTTDIQSVAEVARLWKSAQPNSGEFGYKTLEELGVKTVGAFPILVGNTAVGVLEFFSDTPIDRGERLLSLMADVGTLLGRVVERQRAVRQLRQSESHYRTLVETAGSAIVGLTPDHKIMEWNRQAERIFGWPRGEVLGTNYLERFLPEETRDAVAENIRRELAGEPTYDYENLVVCRDGSTRTISWNSSRLLDESGQPIGIISVGRDVTEQKRAEAVLERAKFAVEATGIGVYEVDLTRHTISWSPELNVIFGLPHEAPADHPCDEAPAHLHPDDRERVTRAIRDSYDPQGSGEFQDEHQIVRPDGTVHWVLVRGRTVFRGDGPERQPIRAYGTVVDITDRKQAEQARKESAERLRALLNAAPDAIVSVDRTGVITDVNPAAEQLFGYTADELLGQNVSLLMPSPYREEHDGYIERYLKTREPHIIGIGREVQAQCKDGRIFPIELAVNEIDHMELFIGIIRDISRRKELEKQVVDAAADEQRRIGQDIHDGVGQELTGLRYMAQTHAETLAESASPDAKTALRMTEWLETVQQQLRAIIRELVPVEVDQHGLVAALRGLAERTVEVHDLECVLECSQPILVPDTALATHLYRIVQEAVRNAVRHAQASRIVIRISEGKDNLKLQVTDDGVGIHLPPSNHNGIGLRSMQYRASLIGATLDFRAAEQGGTQVTCTVSRGGVATENGGCRRRRI